MKSLAAEILTSSPGHTWIFSAGQAGFIIKSASGQYLCIDLYLSDCVERLEGHKGYKRLVPKVLDPDAVEFDVVICTHPHFDHFDIDAVPAMLVPEKTSLLCSVDCKKLVDQTLCSYYKSKINYVKPGDCIRKGDFAVDFVNCDHGAGAPDAVGVIVTVDGKRILEVGDTCLRLDRTEEYLEKGGIDVLIAPINGAYGNLDESECAVLAEKLQAGITIPCHYGMFASHGGSPGKFYEIMKSQYPGLGFELMAPGDRLEI